MARYGFIKTKEDVKFLILYSMCYLPDPATFEIMLDVCTWCDDGFTWFDFKEAFDELVATGHISIADPCADTTYQISKKAGKRWQRSRTAFPTPSARPHSARRCVWYGRRTAMRSSRPTAKPYRKTIIWYAWASTRYLHWKCTQQTPSRHLCWKRLSAHTLRKSIRRCCMP